MMILRYLVAALLLFIVGTIAAFVYLPWWQALLVIVAMVFAIVIGFKLIMRSFMNNLSRAVLAGFEIKGHVLRGASAEVHSVEAAPAPPPRIIDEDDVDDEDDDDFDEDDDDESDDEEDEDQAPRELAYYRIDVTIRPNSPQVPMTHWDLGDLCVVDYRAAPLTLDPNDQTDAGEGFHFDDVQVLEDGRLEPDEQGKYEGDQRVNLLVGVPPELRELKFRYYTEQFGRIVLPPPLSKQLG